MLRLVASLALALAAAPRAAAQVLGGVPIWSANASSNFVLFRAPEFTLRAPALSARLFFTALGSPRPPAGTTQAKLLGAAMIYVNGVLVGGGPGHNTPTSTQAVRGADVLPFLRGGGAPNVLGVASFFARQYASAGEEPRLQAVLAVTDAGGSYNVTPSGPDTWMAWPADTFFNPTGDAGVSWYPIANEDLDRRVYPLGWASPGFAPATPWPAAVAAAPWPAATPLYYEPGPIPVTLARGPCAISTPAPGRQIIDYGQEFMGGVNLTLIGAAGTTVSVVLAEELNPGNASVRSPLRTGNRWNSTWTLSGVRALDAAIVQHEFVQFRYAQVDGDVALLDTDSARAWVIQHPAGGDGRNPWEAACSTSTPATVLWGGAAQPARTPLAALSSSSPALDAVWAFCAYSIVATTLDVNVDGQTRERDVDIVDALNTALGQYYVLSPGDVSVAARTARECFTNDTGMWSQWYDFKASSVMLAKEHALFTGDLALPAAFWSDSDAAITSDADARYNSLQFEAGLRYANASGSGLMHFDARGSCGGSWACDGLIDWPTTTRDGYDCSPANSDDTGRSALGVLAIDALAQLAGWLGHDAAAARYAATAAGVRAALARTALRSNGSEAYFVDGLAGAPASHAAIHSTVYATSAGAADAAPPATISALVAFMRRHGVAPSSCMMGRWWVTGLYRIGISVAAAADLALDVLTSDAYPSWLDMIAQGASVTTEAWRAADKANCDWAHPWCASPSFTIPAGTLGVLPTAPGWARWHAWPQPSSLTALTASIPTPAGMLALAWSAAGTGSAAAPLNATLALSVLPGQSADVCLPVPGAAPALAALGLLHDDGSARAAAQDVLLVDGVAVDAVAIGRFLCAPQPLAPGAHVVSRITSVGAAAAADE